MLRSTLGSEDSKGVCGECVCRRTELHWELSSYTKQDAADCGNVKVYVPHPRGAWEILQKEVQEI
jgi:hypothetical protein